MFERTNDFDFMTVAERERLLCKRIDELYKENERLKKENEELKRLDTDKIDRRRTTEDYLFINDKWLEK